MGRQRFAEEVDDLNQLPQQWAVLLQTEAQHQHTLHQEACNQHQVLPKYGFLCPYFSSCEYGGHQSLDRRYR